MNDTIGTVDLEQRLEESRNHGGQVVARFQDGTTQYADSYEDLFNRLYEAGVDFRKVVIGFVPPADATMLY